MLIKVVEIAGIGAVYVRGRGRGCEQVCDADTSSDARFPSGVLDDDEEPEDDTGDPDHDDTED